MIMRKQHSTFLQILFFTSISTLLLAQKTSYRSPVNHKIYLAGSFGELRGSHFHAGIDIKPSNGREGDTIYSIADGDIVRIKIQRGGFGRAIYINHPDGRTSVYAHMQKIFEPMSSMVYNAQVAKENYEVDINLDKNRIKVKRGQPIGLLGNAGNSYGAHLHFELRETVKDIPLNPSLYGFVAVDKIVPTIGNVAVQGLDPEYRTTHYQSVKFVTNDKSLIPETKIPAWRAGVNLMAYDLMNGVPNKNGVYSIHMFVDDTLYYHSEMDKIAYEEGHLIDCYIDYTTKKSKGRTEAQLFRLPTNNVSAVKYTKEDGVVALYSERSRNICIQVKDAAGNESSAYFKLLRDTNMVSNLIANKDSLEIQVAEINKFKVNDMTFEFPQYSVVKNTPFYAYKNAFSKIEEFRIGDANYAVLKDFMASFPMPTSFSKTDKLTLVLESDGKLSSQGIKIVDGKVFATLSNFGKYRFMQDNQGVKILPLSQNKKSKSPKELLFKLDDNITYSSPSNKYTYKVYIDGKYVPCELKELTAILTVPINQLSKGSYKLRIVTSDMFGNKEEYNTTFAR